MDRKSSKEIKILLAIWFAFSFLLSAGMYLFAKGVIDIHNTQFSELSIIHPELEITLKENFFFYSQQMTELIWHLWFYLILLSAIISILFYFIWKREQKKEEKSIFEEVDAIEEQLEQFHKGDFQLLPFFLEERNESMKEDVWIRIRERFRELGYYFSALKEQLAEEENRTKALITDISHQLKTPLASLKMSHELSREENLTDSERDEFLTQEEFEINKLESLLGELVQLSRLENNMIQVRPQEGNITKTITEAVNQVFMKAYRKGIEIQVYMDRDIIVRHDPKWTVEALANIIDNAIKYSQPQTCIIIRVSCLPSNVLIEIEDEGMGISEKEIHKIFKRFYRGREARKYVKDGAGVGLYLARNIIEQQGGSLVAKRKMQQGTIFKITLPLS